jgi:hypothetical protein
MTPFANNVSVDRRFHNAFLASIIGRRQVAVLVVVALVCWIGTVPAGRGQCSRDTTYTLYTFDGEAAGDAFGYSVSGAGDVNNDGCDDLIVGAPHNDAGGNSAGRAYVCACQVEDPIARGDANADGAIDLDDAVYILNYLFKAGPAPFPFDAGDANCDGIIDVRDAVYLLNYLFKGGPPPGCP